MKGWFQSLPGLAVGLLGCLSPRADALPFNIGESITGQFDSRFELDTRWATQWADRQLVGVNNGGDGLAHTSDDGRLNFHRGEPFSKRFTGQHDLEMRYRDSGIFLRGQYWYDFELMDESRPYRDIDDSGRTPLAQSSGAALLDAFVYHNYSIGERPGTVRLGKQVVNWGEGTFIGGGINAINPVDASALHRPGTEFREGLLPVNLFRVSQSLSDNLSAEAFYQLEWDANVSENCGTFFAGADTLAPGCDDRLAVLSPLAPASQQSLDAVAQGQGLDPVAVTAEGAIVPRAGDRHARDGGQWGAALRYFVEPLDTTFGAYFLNYHSRSPMFGGTTPGAEAYAAAAGLGELAPWLIAGNSRYYLEYPENIRLYGLSFSTTLVTGTAWRGEVSYRPNAPVALNSTDVLLAPLAGSGIADYADYSPLEAGAGDRLQGYRRKEVTQLQTSLVHVVDNLMGADHVTLTGELAWVHVGGLESSSWARYGRNAVFGPGPLTNGACGRINAASLGDPTANNVNRYCEDDGFVTRNAWGYRLRAVWDYRDALAGVDLKPNLAWSHDVDGYGPNGTFTEGAKAVSLGLDAEYQDTYTASLSYTRFFDGKYNTLVDRDYARFSIGVAF